MEKQQTLAKEVSILGTGLHSGKEVTVTLKPAEEFTGIVFHRTDVTPGSGAIEVCASAVCDTQLCTKLKNDYGTEVGTVEHLMAALFATGVDNVIVELNAEEIPLLDGSSQPWLELIDEAGRVEQSENRKQIKILKEVVVKEGNCIASVKPSNEFTLHVFVDYGYHIPPQKADFLEDEIFFRKEVATARTFCFEKDVEYMREAGLIKGGSLESALVYGEKGLVNEGGEDFLRFKNEPLRHKALDCYGDFYMAGYRIIGAFNLTRPGHGINNKLLREVLGNKENWKWV